MKFLPVCLFLVLSVLTVHAGQSPKAFQRYVGSFSGDGTFEDVSVYGEVAFDIEAEAALQMATLPTRAVLQVGALLEDDAGSAKWTFTFARQGRCVIDIVYPNGVARVIGTYETLKKRKVVIKGSVQYYVNDVVKLGTCEAVLRMSRSRLRLSQSQKYTDEVVTMGCLLNRDES